MNLKIDIPPQTFERLQLQASQDGVAMEAFILAALNERLDSASPPPKKAPSADQFATWLREWSGKFPKLPHRVDDRRESFYTGREE